ncbi:MAG: leucine--tRNA ligase, partial [Clostridia bacterium]|nr:leucine--tRNA ligase [Clostridia bacterium]
MNMLEIEKKWQKFWEENKINEFDHNSDKKKFYCLEMFSYPSAAKLHVGHWYNYGLTDSFARYKKMKGFNVFQPMGFDAFGLPAENYAIKTGIHPEDSTLKNIATMEEQLKAIGAMFDWSAEIKTCLPDYYKWTQWLFLKLYENGLAYRKEAPVNWCPSCNTVLANEQASGGVCERCGSTVVKKDLTQWFFKITAYAEELLEKLDGLDWPEKTKLMQKNWIGKSYGAEVEFTAESGDKFKVFTTRVDTIFGVSYVVLAPEHPLVKKLMTADREQAVLDYIDMTSKTTEIDRLSSEREKTGVFIGAYAINPANDKKIPIYAADYVLYSYGTGAVMGVPSHDERDFAFANKYGLPITRVITDKFNGSDLPYCEDGYLVNSGEFDGLYGDDARKAIVDKLEKQGCARFKVNYRLRDWLISRQRYWGAPIPIIHCKHCGDVAVPYGDLPVKLPYDVEFKPDGKSPLAKHEKFMHTKCPKCGAD